eukprot:4256461-Ditylum_brightwellii.AAC.1
MLPYPFAGCLAKEATEAVVCQEWQFSSPVVEGLICLECGVKQAYCQEFGDDVGGFMQDIIFPCNDERVVCCCPSSDVVGVNDVVVESFFSEDCATEVMVAYHTNGAALLAFLWTVVDVENQVLVETNVEGLGLEAVFWVGAWGIDQRSACIGLQET